MNQIPHSHPLDKLISDDRLFLLEAILPFVEGPMRMPLVIYLKMMELQQIMRVINNQSYIRQCDFNRDLHNQMIFWHRWPSVAFRISPIR